ncbi:hemerythrin domain-containing protein [Actinomadura sp. WMMB 499]|uniref:hemerythrin domain-containing protein n=1 Tax=Actinomadura sp. WMMB 499 TaxID=1219491 RepID=UPI001246E928|nr:hemerythrin domain-containing protein [Actinomadura sp. WMMB 499]QFG27209.1 hemerythrin domain-containing protein [Actinomadura sp. WMMB 499]
MDAIELLKHDHRMVEQLLRDFTAAASDRQRWGVVDILVRELSKHAAVEELIFYPFAGKALRDEALVQRHLAEHMALKEALAELDALSRTNGRTNGRTDGRAGGRAGGLSTGRPGGRAGELVELVRRDVEEHVQDEEGELMPRLREAADEAALHELGRKLEKAKGTAPTRPHPHAPDRPPALTVAAPVAAAYDRMRDRMQGRPRT